MDSASHFFIYINVIDDFTGFAFEADPQFNLIREMGSAPMPVTVPFLLSVSLQSFVWLSASIWPDLPRVDNTMLKRFINIHKTYQMPGKHLLCNIIGIMFIPEINKLKIIIVGSA